MKYLLLVCLIVMLAGCSSNIASEERPTEMIDKKIIYQNGPTEVYKFYEGDILCYVYTGYQKGGISCLREATSSVGH
jgi:hypothetical protein